MLLWSCDICQDAALGRPTAYPMARVFVWPDGMNHMVDGRSRARMPNVKMDVCIGCVEQLSKHMRKRHSARRGGPPRCCICANLGQKVYGKTLIRILPAGREEWHQYMYSGLFCRTHAEPLVQRGRATQQRAPYRTSWHTRRQEIEYIKSAILGDPDNLAWRQLAVDDLTGRHLEPPGVADEPAVEADGQGAVQEDILDDTAGLAG